MRPPRNFSDTATWVGSATGFERPGIVRSHAMGAVPRTRVYDVIEELREQNLANRERAE